MDARELFDLWVDEHENKDFTYEKWAEFLKAHDEFPLFIVFCAGMRATGWISVKDRLPEKDALYLIHAPSLDEKKPLITCAWYNPNLPGWSMLVECWLKAITHWMPLPEPPKE